jgi:transglutaminase-like putative cysteine protease
MQAIFKRLFHIEQMIFVFSLTALLCLPFALSDVIRDAEVSLLLPITLFGLIFAWILAGLGVRRSLSAFALLFLAPLAIYIRIGQMGSALIELIRQWFIFIPSAFNTLVYKGPLDFSFVLLSTSELTQKIFGFNGRLWLWLTNIVRGIKIEDPVARTFVWSTALWLIAVWAGWQIYRNKKFMLGMLPSTVVLAFVLNSIPGEKTILWVHLVLLLFLFGLTNYNNLLGHWNTSSTDYSESTSIDTLFMAGVLTLGLVASSYFVSTFSIQEFVDNFREKRVVANASHPESPRPESVKDNFRVTGFQNGLPRSYLLGAGPEISNQLAMTISTGDLPPLPPSAHPIVPRYYWRTLTYSIYTGAGWANPSVLVEDISADQPLIKASDPNYRTVHAQVTFPNDTSDRLYWTGTLVSADVPFKAAWNHQAKDNSILDSDLLSALASAKSYKVESLLLNVSTQDLSESPSVYPAWVRNQFLALPDSVPERVLALARDLTASEPTAYDRALAIQNYLRKYPYTLDISTPPAGRDVTDYFLFDLKKGYCDYYATSMVVLARAAGLPARLVAGYANGAYNVERAQYVVTENYAHSWVEIYFANIGWVEFEPTASQPVITYEAGKGLTTPVVETSPGGLSLGNKFAPFFQRIFNNALLPTLLILICGFLWIGFDALRLTRLDPSRTIQLLYKRLRRFARPVTGYASKDQTAHSFSLSLIEKLSAINTWRFLQNWLAPSRNEINQLTELFAFSLFTPRPPTRADSKDAIKVWSRLRWRLVLANMLQFKK